MTDGQSVQRRIVAQVGAAVAIVVVLVGVLALRPSGAVRSEADGSVRDAAIVLRGDLLGDSWWPMHEATQLLHDSVDSGSVYQELLDTQGLKFQYPQTSLLIGKVFWKLGVDVQPFYDASVYVSLVVTALAVYGIARWSLRRHSGVEPGRWPSVGLAVAAGLITLLYQPVVWGAALGQIQVWINAAFAVSLYCLLTGRERWAGVLMGLAACIKPQYALFVLWGLLRKRRRFTLSVLVTGLLGFVAGGVGFGFSMYLDYVEWLRYIGQRGESYHLNHSVNGLVNRLVGLGQPDQYNNLEWSYHSFAPYNPWVYYATLISSVAILAVSLFRRRGAPAGDLGADYSLAALGFTMAAPIAWDHHYGVLLPIFAYLWPKLWFDPRYAGRWGLRAATLAAFVLTVDRLWFTDLLASTPLNVFQSVLLFAAVAVFVVLVLVRREPVEPESVAPPPADRTPAGQAHVTGPGPAFRGGSA